ncbi:glucose-6-phosphate exchanger SLC37A2 isoform X2 [Episyrphus balteatus]|uniref:glucose-6-phosphate exchanger SLC37A2 isoform X2 n=1 Tax=Episyrphus balteatus TaxID=286459 RepID=UPI002485A3CC|nr:glucose-6-phosphate exchanger SLC37A2 isoform X2 [Episyrphus balteatus]
MIPHKTRKMSTSYNDIPFGVKTILKLSQKCCPRAIFPKFFLFKSSILVLTYLSYTCYHMTRKPISVVKSVLHINHTNPDNTTTEGGYAPFHGHDAQTLFGALDSAFLFSYAAAMFASGFVAERVSLRYFLAFGMMLSGIFSYLFGIAKTYNIHSLWYFLIIQACAGIVQTTGWPGVVTVVGRWFGKSKRGLIFGIWNSHTSIGNILGSLIAAHYVESDWSMSFIVPGVIAAVLGFMIFLFLVDSPEQAGFHQRPSIDDRISNSSDIEDGAAADFRNAEVSYRPTERTPILERSHSLNSSQDRRPIGLIGALSIPGVIDFSLCLFFSKLVSYTFLYWLPLYIQSSTTLGASLSADLSTVFDVGGIIGAITAGMISDYTGMSATTCSIMLFLACPVLLLYNHYGAISLTISIGLLFLGGILVNGPYALITTSVSAELGQHSSLEGNSKALATVTAIIDGTGSIGAAVGPLVAGMISSQGWENVFYMLIFSNVIAMTMLARLVIKELSKLKRNTRRE